MTSLNEIAYNILNSLRGGRSSNNDYLSTDQIKYVIKYYRSMLIRQDQERNFNRYKQFEQDLGYVPLQEIDTAESSTLNSYKFLWRTSSQIPKPIRLKRSEAITFIGNEDKFNKPIPFIDENRSYWNNYNKYTSSEPEAFYRNGYIYIKSNKHIENINIRGIFEDPEKVFDFVNEQEGNFKIYDANSPFPIPSDMIDQITMGILNGTLKLAVTTPNDTTTDTLQGA